MGHGKRDNGKTTGRIFLLRHGYAGTCVLIFLCAALGFGCASAYREIPDLEVRPWKNSHEVIEYGNGWKAKRVYDDFWESHKWEIYDPHTRKWYRSRVDKENNRFVLTEHSAIQRHHDYHFDSLAPPGGSGQ